MSSPRGHVQEGFWLCWASSPHRLFPRAELSSGRSGRSSWVVAQGSVAPPHVGSSWARDGNCAPSTGRWILNPWPTRDTREGFLENADCTAHVVEPQRQDRGCRGPAVRLSAASSCTQGPCSGDGWAAAGVDSGGRGGLLHGGRRAHREEASVSSTQAHPRRPSVPAARTPAGSSGCSLACSWPGSRAEPALHPGPGCSGEPSGRLGRGAPRPHQCMCQERGSPRQFRPAHVPSPSFQLEG